MQNDGFGDCTLIFMWSFMWCAIDPLLSLCQADSCY